MNACILVCKGFRITAGLKKTFALKLTLYHIYLRFIVTLSVRSCHTDSTASTLLKNVKGKKNRFCLIMQAFKLLPEVPVT